MMYNNVELRQFDKEMEAYKIDGKHSKQTLLNYLEHERAIRIYPNGTIGVIADPQIENEQVTVTRYPKLMQKIEEWLLWLGRKEYAQKKELERLDTTALDEKFSTPSE